MAAFLSRLLGALLATDRNVKNSTTLASLFCLAAVLLPGSLSRGQSASGAGAEAETSKSKDFLFEVRPREIMPGEVAVLRWSIKGATKVTIEAASNSEIGRRELIKVGSFEGGDGTLKVTPKEDTTYVIACEGSTTYTCASLTLRVRVKSRKGL